MTQETKCPACGAPIVTTGEENTIRCGFCGTELSVSDENGQPSFRVVGQPEPQADVLSERASEEIGQAIAYESTDSEPVLAPGWQSQATEPAGVDDFLPKGPAFTPEMPVTVDSIPEVPPYQAGRSAAGTTGGSKRWIGIAVAVFVVACLLCACMAGIAMIFQGQIGGF